MEEVQNIGKSILKTLLVKAKLKVRSDNGCKFSATSEGHVIAKMQIFWRERWSSGYWIQKIVGSKPGAGYWMDIYSHDIVINIAMFV